MGQSEDVKTTEPNGPHKQRMAEVSIKGFDRPPVL